jgi:hypothetical protein
MGYGQDAGGKRGALAGADGVVGDAGGVYHTGGGEMARLRGVLGKLGGWNTFGGRSGGSGIVLRRFRAVASGLEWGEAGGSAIVDKRADSDVAELVDMWGVVVGSWGTTGVWGASRGKQGGADRCRGRRRRRWGWQSRSVECTTHSDERIRTTSCNGICWAVEGVGASFTAG